MKDEIKSNEVKLPLEAQNTEKWKEAGVDDLIQAEKVEEIKELQGIYKYSKQPEGKRESWLYGFETNGVLREIWGSAVLDRKMKQIPFGSKVQLEYLGKEKSEKTKGREYHNVSVKYVEPVLKEA